MNKPQKNKIDGSPSLRKINAELNAIEDEFESWIDLKDLEKTLKNI